METLPVVSSSNGVQKVAKPKIKHTQSDVKVYTTSDYKLFESIVGNRELNEMKIKKIIQDIKGGLDVLMYCPILVSENGEKLKVIDGQHRFHVAKKMRREIHYIISKELSLPEIAKINSNTDKWKDSDFIHCFMEQGSQDYKTLKWFLDEYHFSITTSIKLLSRGLFGGGYGGGAGYAEKTAFRDGLFKVGDKKEAIRLAEEIKKFSFFGNYKSAYFVTAILRIIKSDIIYLDDLVRKCSVQIDSMAVQGSVKDYLVHLETLYNYGNHKRKTIY